MQSKGRARGDIYTEVGGGRVDIPDLVQIWKADVAYIIVISHATHLRLQMA